MRQDAAGATMRAVDGWFDDYTAWGKIIDIDIEAPGYLATGAAVAPPASTWLRRYIPRNGLALALLLTAALLALVFLIGQISLSIRPLSNTGFGHWIGSALPAMILILLLALFAWRVLLWRWQMEEAAGAEMVRALSDQSVAAMIDKVVDVKAQASLHTRFTDDDWQVRQAAAQALADHPTLTDAFLARLTDNNLDVRRAVGQELARLYSDLTDYPNLTIVRLAPTYFNDWEVAVEAVEVLGPTLADHPALLNALLANNLVLLNVLLARLDDFDWRIQREATQALIEAGQGNARVAAQLIPRLRAKALNSRWSSLVLPLPRALPHALTLIRWVCDWPVLVSAALAQVFVLWPTLARIIPLPPIVCAVFGLTAWWQILLVIVGYLIVNGVIGLIVLAMATSRTWPRNAALEALEGLITDIDDSTRRLKDGQEKPTQ